MVNSLVKSLVRLKFYLSPKRIVDKNITLKLKKYLILCERAGSLAHKRVRVSKMPGVDEDMREWSIYMILEHNTIVNNSITRILLSLEEGKTLSPDERIDPKKDVMPGEAPGLEQINAFRESVQGYLHITKTMKGLRNTPTIPHPVFGEFNAHQWHCMFDFHLGIHLRQGEHILKELKKNID